MDNNDNLHGAIMNIQCKPAYEQHVARMAYREGHRDARHAAAELVNEFAAQAEQTQPAGAARQGGITSIEGLTRYGQPNLPGAEFGMEPDGEYVKFADVAALASQSQAAQPTKLSEARIAELNREAQDQGISGIAPSIYLARAVEREVIAHIAGTSQATQQPTADLADDDRYQHVRDILLDAMRAADEDNKGQLNKALDLLSDIATAPKRPARTSQATKAQAEPIYQVANSEGIPYWEDVSKEDYDSGMYSVRRIVYAAPVAKEAPPLLSVDDYTAEMEKIALSCMKYGPEGYKFVPSVALAKFYFTYVAKEAPTLAQTEADEAKLYRDLTGDAMALGFDGIVAALEALRATRDAETGSVQVKLEVVELLMGVVFCAFHALENTEQNDSGYVWNEADFHALSNVMDKLDELPGDEPGSVYMGPIAKARWALRGIATTTSTVSAPAPLWFIGYYDEDEATADSIADYLRTVAGPLKAGDEFTVWPSWSRVETWRVTDAENDKAERIKVGPPPSWSIKEYELGAQKAPEEVRDAARLDAFTKNPSWELARNDDHEEAGWCLHKVVGPRNDREWREIGKGSTPREAIDAALRTSSTDQANADTGSAA